MRFNIPFFSSLLASAILGFWALSPAPALAGAASPAMTSEFEKFTPHPSTHIRLDFERMDLLVERAILFTGPSLRSHARRQDPYTGTRIVKKHTSPYRLEGNKIVYSMFSPLHRKLIREYLGELEKLPSEINLTSLPRNDQLAYWFNLHNLALINEITKVYPVKYPKDIKPRKGSDAHLHEAKILAVDGVPLSLRDIRENIVYKNWQNPVVIYGFHEGTLGSPSIPAIAFDRNNLMRTLKNNASEFANSLRGFENGKVSSFYKEVAPFYFKNFEADLRAHFQTYMRDEVYAEVEETSELEFHRPIDVVSDTTGGYGKYAAPQNLYMNGRAADIGIPPSVVEYMKENNAKLRRLVDEGLFSYGTVTIEDIETTDESSDVK